MSDYITLLGAEQVQSAGSAMREAGNQMERAASNISSAMDRFERLVERFEVACAADIKPAAIEAGSFMEIHPVMHRFWWPHELARPWLWRNRVVSYRYFVKGVECNKFGEPLPVISGDDLQ